MASKRRRRDKEAGWQAASDRLAYASRRDCARFICSHSSTPFCTANAAASTDGRLAGKVTPRPRATPFPPHFSPVCMPMQLTMHPC